MKLNINKIKLTPEQFGFNFCQFGELTDEVKEWCKFWNFKIEKSEKFTNILINDNTDLNSIFENSKQYDYVDGFSPNLNKHLFQSLKIFCVVCWTFIESCFGKCISKIRNW